MNKGIIVLNMPERCDNCKMGFVNECYDHFECYFKPGIEINQDEEIPDWCPVKPMSKEVKVTIIQRRKVMI